MLRNLGDTFSVAVRRAAPTFLENRVCLPFMLKNLGETFSSPFGERLPHSRCLDKKKDEDQILAVLILLGS